MPLSPIARRLEAAKAAAPFVHAKLNAIDAKLTRAVVEPAPERTSVVVEFVVPSVIDDARDSSPSLKNARGVHHGKGCIQVADNL